MIYELENGKKVKIPDTEIEKSMKLLDLTKEEAIEFLKHLNSIMKERY